MAGANQQARVASMTIGALLAVALVVRSSAATVETVVVWKVGSPHVGDTPNHVVASSLREESIRRGLQLAVDAFPAKGFAARLLDAMTRNAAPDILVFNNLGVVKGITTRLGRFEGIGEDARIDRDLVAVTGAFDELLGPERGWTYLIASSPNHSHARTLALRPPTCPNGSSVPHLPSDLAELVHPSNRISRRERGRCRCLCRSRSSFDGQARPGNFQRCRTAALWPVGQRQTCVRIGHGFVHR